MLCAVEFSTLAPEALVPQYVANVIGDISWNTWNFNLVFARG
jgi:hypothetical protein